jgi:lipoate-protein ligase B
MVREKCQVIRLGLVDYNAAYSMQKELVAKRIRGEIPDTLILLEHEPVFTIGRSGGLGNILINEEGRLREKIALYEVDRGGDVTYHGPGQLVGYPILDLNGYGRDIHKFLRLLEEVIIRVLDEYGLKALRLQGLTGVWVGQKKIASIGVGVRKWVSFHGFSLNIAPFMRHFSLINPCGLGDGKMTSMKELLGREVSIEDVLEKAVKNFSEVFNVSLKPHSNLVPEQS